MSSDPHLAALPALRKRAEEEARSCHEAQVAAIKAKHYGYHAQDLIDALPPAWVDVDAHLSLLCDLTRFASRWELAVLIGARLGWEPVDVLQAIQNGGRGWIELCKAAHVDAAEANGEAITALALVVLGGAS
jgi:hypothetical protein